MRLAVEFTRDLHALYRADVQAGRVGTTAAVKQAGEELKIRWRSRVSRAGLGRGLTNSIRSRAYPQRGESLDAAVVVGPRDRSSSAILHGHGTGARIRAGGVNALYLAVPTDAVPRGFRRKRLDPHEFEQTLGVKLRLVRRGGGRSPALVADGVRIDSRGRARRSRSKTGRGQVSVVAFLLLPEVKLKKRWDLPTLARSVARGLPDKIAEEWVKAQEARKAARRGRRRASRR